MIFLGVAAGGMRWTVPSRSRNRTALAELTGPDQVLLFDPQTLEGHGEVWMLGIHVPTLVRPVTVPQKS